MLTQQFKEDLEYTFNKLSEEEILKLKNSRILITGGAGFLGFYIMHFFEYYFDKLGLKQVICLDNFMLGLPKWLDSMPFVVKKFDIIHDDITSLSCVEDVDYIIHMASIASPMFYRKYPLQTLDANVWGLRKLLDFYKDKNIKGFLFFSSSEIYGNPISEEIPTSEEYHGDVSCTGPRACYDEAKRFGETMCKIFAISHNMPIVVARPFNNYGPGMKINDKRVPADFARNIVDNKNITILSSGSPTRTFCYIADAVVGYFKVLLHGKYDYFNIGIQKSEISVLKLAQIYKGKGKIVFGYKGEIDYAISEDKDYLTNNPQRRCPDISKAQKILGYNPSIDIEQGVERFLRFISESSEENLIW